MRIGAILCAPGRVGFAGMMDRAKLWLSSTPNRSFVLYPVCLIALQMLLYRHTPIVWWGVPLLVWGYLQYRVTGKFRRAAGGGGPGLEIPPERIVDTGLYRYTRNPMYLGHLIFMAGLAIIFQSWLAVAILLVNAVWFDVRVRGDEVKLEQRFGEEYNVYRARVKRWIPFVL